MGNGKRRDGDIAHLKALARREHLEPLQFRTNAIFIAHGSRPALMRGSRHEHGNL